MYYVATSGRRAFVGVFLTISLLTRPEVVVRGQEPYVSAQVQETVIEIVDHEKAAKVKGVFIFQISQFVKWPASEKSDFTIGVVGKGLVQSTLIDISERREIHNKTVKIREFNITDPIRRGECDVIYFAPSVPSSDVSKIISASENWPVLIFTDSVNRPPNTVVNFVIENQKVNFELNNQEAQRRELAMDAKLLRQGRIMQSSSQK